MSKCKPYLVYLVNSLGLHRADVDRMARICGLPHTMTTLENWMQPYAHNGHRQSGVPPQTAPAANVLAHLLLQKRWIRFTLHFYHPKQPFSSHMCLRKQEYAHSAGSVAAPHTRRSASAIQCAVAPVIRVVELCIAAVVYMYLQLVAQKSTHQIDPVSPVHLVRRLN